MKPALDFLKQYPHWVGWKYEPDENGKPTKRPKNPATGGNAMSNNPATWGSFEQANTAKERYGFDGIGFMLKPDVISLVAFDLDHCLVDGQLSPVASEIVNELSTYCEITPSGGGLRLFALGSLPPGRRKNTKLQIECYDRGRFLTVTGNHLPGTPETINRLNGEITEAHTRFWGSDDRPETSHKGNKTGIILGDTELLTKARAAANGDKFSRLFDRGDTSDYGGDDSSADIALCCMLAFWTRDTQQIDRLFRQSKLYRPKWDKKHNGDGQTYGQMTIDKALANTTEHYTPKAQPTKQAAPQANPAPAVTTVEHLTDLGNARRLVSQYGQDLRYCYDWRKWLVWDGQRWRRDTPWEVNRKVKATVKTIYGEAAAVEDDERRKAIAKHATRSEASERLKVMVEQAQSELPITTAELDADPWLLNCPNGTLDLRTGELHPHTRTDMLTKMTTIPYKPGDNCPLWLEFLETVFNGNQDLIHFIQKAVGYTLTGDCSEQVLFILYGTGANGKSVFLETIQAILGEDYARSTPTDTIMVKDGSSINNDIARLTGARLVTVNEVEDGQRLAESLVKQLTGQDTVTARFLHAEFFDFKPQFKLFIRANHKPVIRGTDEGIWRRLRLIPFTVTIPEGQRDPRLLEKLQAELPGILAWVARGCQYWQNESLGLPSEVKAAVDAYRNEMDVIGQFLEDRTVEVSDVPDLLKVKAGDLYKAYSAWCEENGLKTVNSTRFGRLMTERGYQKKKLSTHVFYLGLGLLNE